MTKRAGTRRTLATSPFHTPAPPPAKHFAVGDRVTHDTHGLGRVVALEGEDAVLVDFGSFQQRIISPFSKMTAL